MTYRCVVLAFSRHGDILNVMHLWLQLLVLLGIEPSAVDLHVQVVFHVAFAAAITDPVLVMKRGVVCSIVRAAASRCQRGTLLSILVAKTAAAGGSHEPMPAQVI